jgi:hypothetical protein
MAKRYGHLFGSQGKSRKQGGSSSPLLDAKFGGEAAY